MGKQKHTGFKRRSAAADSADAEAGEWWRSGGATKPASAAHAAAGSAAADAPVPEAAAEAVVATDKPSKKRVKRQKLSSKFEQQQNEWRELIGSGARGARKVLWEQFMLARGDKLSEMELKDVAITDEHFRQVDGFEHTGELEHLATFARGVVHTKKENISAGKQEKEPGTPRLIVLSSGAVRAVDVHRALRPCQTGPRPLLNSKPVDMAAGTPQRVMQLIENGALKLHPKLVIMLDCTFRDERKRTIFEIPEVNGPLMELLEKHIFPLTAKTGAPKLSLF